MQLGQRDFSKNDYFVYIQGIYIMAQTNVIIDDELIDPGLAITGLKTRRALIDHALREFVRHKAQKKILELKGEINWEGDLASWRRGRRR